MLTGWLPGAGAPWFWLCCREPNSCLILSEKSGCLIRSSVDWLPETPCQGREKGGERQRRKRKRKERKGERERESLSTKTPQNCGSCLSYAGYVAVMRSAVILGVEQRTACVCVCVCAQEAAAARLI